MSDKDLRLLLEQLLRKVDTVLEVQEVMKGDIAAIKSDVSRLDKGQDILSARLNDQWNVINALIPTKIAAVGSKTAAE